jgi:hypothetical protein
MMILLWCSGNQGASAAPQKAIGPPMLPAFDVKEGDVFDLQRRRFRERRHFFSIEPQFDEALLGIARPEDVDGTNLAPNVAERAEKRKPRKAGETKNPWFPRGFRVAAVGFEPTTSRL